MVCNIVSKPVKVKLMTTGYARHLFGVSCVQIIARPLLKLWQHNAMKDNNKDHVAQIEGGTFDYGRFCPNLCN